MNHLRAKLALGAVAATALAGAPLAANAATNPGPPPAATAFATGVITPSGGSVSGFGITATFAPGAVTSDSIAILGNWPNGLDVTPPAGQDAVKTFGLQICADNAGTPQNCTSEFGNYPNSPASGGTEFIHGVAVAYTAPQSPTSVDFGSANNKLVTITVDTTGTSVYIYNPNFTTTAMAYPKLLPSTSVDGVLTFQTFQPIVWTVTSPSS